MMTTNISRSGALLSGPLLEALRTLQARGEYRTTDRHIPEQATSLQQRGLLTLLPGPDRQTIRVRVTERGAVALEQAGEAGL